MVGFTDWAQQSKPEFSMIVGICPRIAIYCGPMPVIQHRLYPLPEVFHGFIGLPNSSKPHLHHGSPLLETDSQPTCNRRHLDISSETCTIPGPAPMMPWESNKSSQESISCIVHQHITATDFKPRDTKGPTLCSMSASAAASTDVSPVLTDADWLSQTSRPGSGTFPATTAAPQ